MSQVKVIGISGSPRKKGHTAVMVQEALKAASEIENVTTEYFTVAELNVKPCRSCSNKAGELICATRKCIINDDMTNMLYEKLLEADGIIIGSPVYFGSISAQLKAILDRTINIKMRKLWLRHKVGAAITVAAHRHGGQEATIQAINSYFMINAMIIASDGPPSLSEYSQWSSTTYDNESAKNTPAIWGRAHFPGGFAEPNFGAIEQDKMSIINAQGTGRNVAMIASWIKAHRPELKRETYPLFVGREVTDIETNES